MFLKILKGFGYFLLFALVTLVLIAAGLLISNKTKLTLPTPTGQYPVGRVIYDWKDGNRVDSLSPALNEKRELLVWIWYPCKKINNAAVADYMPKQQRKQLKKLQGEVLRNLITHDECKVICHSLEKAPISPGQQKYPVVVLRSGIGAFATDYTTLAEDLASHGYIVVGADAPYSTLFTIFPDGRVINRTGKGNPGERGVSEAQQQAANKLVRYWSADVHFILDKLTELNDRDTSTIFWQRLDMQSVGIVGHSFGGATAAQACHDDLRIKAGIDIDGQPFGTVITNGMNQPFMILLGDHSKESGVDAIQAKLQSVYDNVRSTKKFWLTIPTANHFNFSDQCLLKNAFVGRRIGAFGSIGPRRGLEVTGKCIRAFFDVQLKQQPDSIFSNMLVQNAAIVVSEVHRDNL